MIELKNVSKYYHTGSSISMGLHNISVTLNQGEIVAITGDSGSGKSTLLNVITKIDTFDEGEIYYKGNETSYFSISEMDDFRKNKVGFIFQNYNIIDSYTVLENVMLPLLIKGISANEAREKAKELIEKVGLSHRLSNRGKNLSGGEKQRCVIARALATDCDILACDEPTGNLDSKTGAEIVELIKEVAKNKLVLIVTHNYEQVEHIVTRKIRIADGEIVEDETFREGQGSKTEEMVLSKTSLKMKTSLHIAARNIINTPRKTILLSLIFLTICLATLFMFQGIAGAKKPQLRSAVYKNTLETRAYLYKTDHGELDEKVLNGYEWDRNPFYEDYLLEYYVSGYSDLDNLYCTYSDHYTYTLSQGKMPEEENEIILLVGEDMDEVYYNTEDILGAYLEERALSFKISGFGIVQGLNHGVITGNQRAKALIQQEVIYYNTILNIAADLKKASVFEKGLKKPYWVLPEYVKDYPKELSFFGIYELSPYVEIRYDSSVTGYVYHYSDVAEDVFPIWEASVYSSSTSKLQKNLSHDGVIVDICNQMTNETPYQAAQRNLSTYSIMALASLSLVVVFFLSYVILSKVYASKKKDYEILRTLGITKKDMRFIVDYEIITVGLVTTLLGAGIFALCMEFIPFLESLGAILPGALVLYFIGMILFTLCLAQQFNQRLFKFSVSKSLKGGHKA